MSNDNVYEERLYSIRTEALFVILSVISLLLTLVFVNWKIFWLLITIPFLFFVFFLFYALNYPILKTIIAKEKIILKFGIFTKNIKFDEIIDQKIDTTSMWRIGGAGIHATKIQGVWRMMFNFLEYERVVVKKNTGFNKEIAFSTKNPKELIEIVKKYKKSD
jgi:hypothetical protein